MRFFHLSTIKKDQTFLFILCQGSGYGGQGWCVDFSGHRGGCNCSINPFYEKPVSIGAVEKCVNGQSICESPCTLRNVSDRDVGIMSCLADNGAECECPSEPSENSVEIELFLVEFERKEMLPLFAEEDRSEIVKVFNKFVGMDYTFMYVRSIEYSVPLSEDTLAIVYQSPHEGFASKNTDSILTKGTIDCQDESSRGCEELCQIIKDNAFHIISSLFSIHQSGENSIPRWAEIGFSAPKCGNLIEADKGIPPSNTSSFAVCMADGITGSAVAGESCSFPFVLNGVTFWECVKDNRVESGTEVPLHDSMNQGWCITKTGAWGGCLCGPFSSPPTPEPEVDSVSPEILDVVPECDTNGIGSAPAGERCNFPFIYQGIIHFECVGNGWGGEGFCETESGLFGGCKCSPNFTPSAAPTGDDSLACVTNGIGFCYERRAM